MTLPNRSLNPNARPWSPYHDTSLRSSYTDLSHCCSSPPTSPRSMPHATPEPQLIPPSPEPRRTTLNPNARSWYPKEDSFYYLEETPHGPRVVSKEELRQRRDRNQIQSGKEIVRGMLMGEGTRPSVCVQIDVSKRSFPPKYREMMLRLYASVNRLLWESHIRFERSRESFREKMVDVVQDMDRIGCFDGEFEAD
jgi:hypothetical protein